ncbi:WXG100 family type VII secretion target [Nocardia sp. NPDC059240]|uniref:WXG100 family type VII secretion target n=1 Tax=Nocardia sp. NPDC059240 TaxID=3346786 RepID=UPI0036C5BE35
MNSNDYSVDLNHIDQVTTRIRTFAEYLTDHLTELELRAQQLKPSWTGEAAAAYDHAHGEWINAARAVHTGLKQLEAAARAAHGNYGNATSANTRMFDV